MEDGVEDERQNKCDEGGQTRFVEGAREGHESLRLGPTARRVCVQRVAKALARVERRSELVDVLKGRVDTEAKVRLDRMDRVA